MAHQRPLVGRLGFEPRTNGLKIRCSNRLSYRPESRRGGFSRTTSAVNAHASAKAPRCVDLRRSALGSEHRQHRPDLVHEPGLHRRSERRAGAEEGKTHVFVQHLLEHLRSVRAARHEQ